MTLAKKLGFLMAFILPTLVVFGYFMGGAWNFSNFLFAYGLVPLIDELVGKDPVNIKKEDLPILSGQVYFEAILHMLVYAHLILIIWGCYVISAGTMTGLEIIGFTLSLMVLSSGMINVAHELGHKTHWFARFQSQLTLMSVCYMHFYIEHNKGHHVNVATPKDPATSKKDQTYYNFWKQSVIGSWKDAWEIEKKRLQRKKLAIWGINNMMLWYAIIPCLFVGGLTLLMALIGQTLFWAVPLFFFTQAFLAFSTLEAVNYIEHYGLMRKEVSPGRYERVNPLHSWNSNHMVSNFLLFQLQRHSDHHAYAARPYQILRHFDESPQLPAGYPVMVLMSLVPALWFKNMNKRLENWQSKSYDAEYISKVVKAVG